MLDNLLLTLAFPQKSYTTGTDTALKTISLFTLLDRPIHSEYLSLHM